MSTRDDMDKADVALTALLAKFVPPDLVDDVVDAFFDLASAVADDRLDRVFNRGDYR